MSTRSITVIITLVDTYTPVLTAVFRRHLSSDRSVIFYTYTTLFTNNGREQREATAIAK